MARRKRTSLPLERAKQRCNSIRTVNPTLDLGGGLTVSAYQGQTAKVDGMLDVYNGKLTELDTLLNEIGAEERKLEDLNSRMLAGILARFGRDSSEYEAAGGVRASERRNARNGHGANGGTAASQPVQPEPVSTNSR